MISSVLPLSRTRAEAQADWRTVTRLPRWRSPLPSRAEIFESSEMTVPIKQRIQWDERLLPMQRLKITEIQGVLRDKEDVAGIRCECATAFEQMAKSWLKMASDAGLRDGILNQAEAGDNIIETNLVCVAAWMVDLLNLGKRLTTLRTYLSDIKAILATFPNQPLWELGDAEREQIAEFDLLTRSPTKRLAAWRSLRTFLQSLGLPLAALSSKNPRCERQTVAEDIFTPADVPKLMGALADIGTPQAHEAFIATPFAFYATLRIDEVLSIRICHMMLAGDAPYLDIRNAKGAKSRRVYLTHVPPELLTQLRELRNDRVTELRKRHPKLGSEALFQLPFIDPGRVDVSSLEKVFQKAAQRIGRGSCTFHDLRKGGANWRYANGTDVRLIAQGLGHGACGVTYLSYLRSTDLRQREAVLRMPHSVQLSRAKLAALLSIEDSSYVTRLAQRNSGHDRLVQNAITVQLAKRVLGISQD